MLAGITDICDSFQRLAIVNVHFESHAFKSELKLNDNRDNQDIFSSNRNKDFG
jgi:hypothetical protein